MAIQQCVCLRQLSQGNRAREVSFGRFLANVNVTTERLIDGWGAQTSEAVAGRHVLAIQDTSEVNFRTRPERRRGLGEIGKGTGHGLLAHVMVALDAGSGSCLGLVGGAIYTRKGRIETPHAKRALKDKESRRWLDTAEQAKTVLASAAMITVIADRESDIYAGWASVPGGNLHLLSRAMHDRAVAGGGKLSDAAARWPFAETRTIDLLATPTRAARQAALSLRFGTVEVLRPDAPDAHGQPKTVTLRLVEVVERNPPPGVEPVHWRLLTTHAVADHAAAWQIVDWYRRRWTIEQLFRLIKTKGLQLEDSQLTTAEALIKLTAVAVKAAAVILQLMQARQGIANEPAEIAFTPQQILALVALNARTEGRTALQKNPHPPASMAWAAWIIGRLGGWNGYRSSKPPGPITFANGLERFHAIAEGWALRDLCIP